MDKTLAELIEAHCALVEAHAKLVDRAAGYRVQQAEREKPTVLTLTPEQEAALSRPKKPSPAPWKKPIWT